MSKRQNRSFKVKNEFRQVLEAVIIPLSDLLVNELVATKGIPRVELEQLRDLGFGYCLKRGTFMTDWVSNDEMSQSGETKEAEIKKSLLFD